MKTAKALSKIAKEVNAFKNLYPKMLEAASEGRFKIRFKNSGYSTGELKTIREAAKKLGYVVTDERDYDPLDFGKPPRKIDYVVISWREA